MKLLLLITVFIASIGTWIPGCESQKNIHNQLDQIENQLKDYPVAEYSLKSEYSIPYDTTLPPVEIQFSADPNISDGQKIYLAKEQGITAWIQYDSIKGVLVGSIHIDPVKVDGFAKLRTMHQLKPTISSKEGQETVIRE